MEAKHFLANRWIQIE